MKTNFFLLLFFIFLTGYVFAQKTDKNHLNINGRIQYDYEFLKRENQSVWFNGNEFRRVHLSVSGHLSVRLKYKIETDFSHGELGFRDVYIKYNAGNLGAFALGSMAEPTGLDMLTSSKYIPFLERAMLGNLQNFRWGSGLHYENFGIFNGKLTLQMALTNNGSANQGFKDENLEEGMNFTARITSALFQNETGLWHLGINYASRPASSLKFRPENHMGDKYVYVFPEASGRDEIGFEMAGVLKNFSLQSEYKLQVIDNSINKDYKVKAFYVMASYFLTGEQRPYKKAAFARLIPKKDIDNEGIGAVELLCRFSNINVSDDIVLANFTQPANINNISFGVNWYLTKHARLMYNYVLTDDENVLLGNLSGHLIRFQIDF